jgi:RNA polymerase sigma-B factor
VIAQSNDGSALPRPAGPGGRVVSGPARSDSSRVQRLFRRYSRFGDTAARDELVRRFLPLAHRLARRYRRGPESLDDLVQVASIGLLHAIDRFDPERGTPFTTFAVPTIVGELKHYFRDFGWAVHVSRPDQDRALAVERTIEELSLGLGRSATPSELAAALGITVEEVLDARETAAAVHAASLDVLVGVDEDESRSYRKRIACHDDELDLVECRDAIARCLRGLPPGQRQIVFMRYGEDLTQSEIGARIGLSQVQVSRLLRRTLEHMQMLAAGIDRREVHGAPREGAKNGRPSIGPSFKSLPQEFSSCASSLP